ncbi:hypothetical protein QJQ45_020449 [Haematococcus lacustris]|nr:hypothetical protein QJQ45_020449 [Haematococcus lacustris]
MLHLQHRPASSRSRAVITRPRFQCRLRAQQQQHEQDAAAEQALRLVMYSKADCALCEGLQSKLESLISRAAFMPSLLTGCQLEVRDIASSQDWQAAYGLVVPVLALQTPGGREVVLPRAPPRMSADRLQRHVIAAVEAVLQD